MLEESLEELPTGGKGCLAPKHPKNLSYTMFSNMDNTVRDTDFVRLEVNSRCGRAC